MARIDRDPSNLFEMPRGAYIRNRIYVYINTSSKYIPASERKDGGTRGYTDHESMCIGVIDETDPQGRKFYPNDRYKKEVLFPVPADEPLDSSGSCEDPDPPVFADSLAIGLYSWIGEAAYRSGLTEDLCAVFGEENPRLILDLSAYMMSKESAVMQHFPPWARDHVLFSDVIRDDTYLGVFLKKTLTIPKIKQFRRLWACRNIGDGLIYLCYDSTNVNCQAQGVSIVQKGHAKDDPSLPQVNTDYVVRQSDGLPLTYLHSPGSVSDIAQAQEMINFMSKLKKDAGHEVVLCLICDRGYISEKNLRHMDSEGLEYILMLRSNFKLYDQLVSSAVDEIISYENALQTPSGGVYYGVTKTCTLYDGGPVCYAHIIYSASRFSSGRGGVDKMISDARTELEAFISNSSGKSFTSDELKWIPSYFVPDLVPGEPRIEVKKKRGKSKQTTQIEIPTFKITGYTDNKKEINAAYTKAGMMILISKRKMTAQECMDAYHKRDCVEKTFEALKSHLGMDKIGVTTEEAIHGKGAVWFVVSILHALMFIETSDLRLRPSGKKQYTVPMMIDELEAIKADKDLSTNDYERRYKLTHKQSEILRHWGIDEKYIDGQIDQYNL